MIEAHQPGSYREFSLLDGGMETAPSVDLGNCVEKKAANYGKKRDELDFNLAVIHGIRPSELNTFILSSAIDSGVAP
ncbi:hypothetical protein Nepgr_011643 [Nepenthes gracilis]|uniref:Uncharacterized protein n=1 Tax=Nepenthes gracilis TaxID=150966 RepID=A0AAD3SET0_NEPGR|nr:hypothetical protein Nepgr_011643 [Nepenthes gracilis]